MIRSRHVMAESVRPNDTKVSLIISCYDSFYYYDVLLTDHFHY